MKKILSVFACLFMLSNAASAQKADKVDVSDFSNYGLCYTADFKLPGDGAIMFLGQGLGARGFGFEFGVGWTLTTFDTSDDIPGAVIFKVGPAYTIPLVGNCFATTSLTFCGSGYFDGEHKFHFNPGASFAPRLGCKIWHLVVTAGLDFMYMKGADRIGTSFVVGLGF